MGVKKGRAARRAEQPAGEASSQIRHDDGSCVTFEASNGWTYKVDVLQMVQVNTSKGSRRRVHRQQGHAKWSMWQYEAEPFCHTRNAANAKTVLTQYPKEVCIALETRWRAARAALSKEQAEGVEAVEQDRAEQSWRLMLESLSGNRLRQVFRCMSQASSSPASVTARAVTGALPVRTTSGDGDVACVVSASSSISPPPPSRPEAGVVVVAEVVGPVDARAMAATAGMEQGQVRHPDPASGLEDLQPVALATEASVDAALREVLLECALRQARWPPSLVAESLRCLQRLGLALQPGHVRKAALLHGGLTPLRVLLLEAKVDVRGLELLQDHRVALESGSSKGGSGWVQRCKPALKALLARGAVLGSHALQSKLLKRLEEEGVQLWVARALEGLQQDRPELPDVAFLNIAEFACSAKARG